MTYQTECLSHRGTAAGSRAVRFSIWNLLRLHRQRRSLAQMDTAALEDMGITRREAQIEAARPFWQMPHNWTC